MRHCLRRATVTASFVFFPVVAVAAWDPANGQWGKSNPADLRVMTWNIEDGLCSTADKSNATKAWAALARIVAAMRPDVLILQEAGDNSGNGTGSGADSVAVLAGAIEQFLHGGAGVDEHVQRYAPEYDLPHVFVSTDTDNFNRNVIISRFPFADLNGDGVDRVSDILVLQDAYATTGDGGVRGFAFAEIDLPDDLYGGDVVIGNGHLKAFSGASNHQRRVAAAQRVVYYIDYLYNGAGTGTPDPNNKIIGQGGSGAHVLDDQTPVIWGGDWNEDEVRNGATKGPADWMRDAAVAGGADGADRDRSDGVYDASADVFTGAVATQSGSKLDYLCWQDSVATLRRSFVFNSATVPSGAIPPELSTFFVPGLASGAASDHRPVIADFILPEPSPLCTGNIDNTGSSVDRVDAADLANLLNNWGQTDTPANLDGFGGVDATDLANLLNNWGPCS